MRQDSRHNRQHNPRPGAGRRGDPLGGPEPDREAQRSRSRGNAAGAGGGATSEEVKLRVLESLAAGRPVGSWGRRACRSLGLESREMRGGVVVEREWTEGAYTLLRRLLSRGWSPAAIAVFCRRSPSAVSQLLGGLGAPATRPVPSGQRMEHRDRDRPGPDLPRTGS
jgi:hypothetical protein